MFIFRHLRVYFRQPTIANNIQRLCDSLLRKFWWRHRVFYKSLSLKKPCLAHESKRHLYSSWHPFSVVIYKLLPFAVSLQVLSTLVSVVSLASLDSMKCLPLQILKGIQSILQFFILNRTLMLCEQVRHPFDRNSIRYKIWVSININKFCNWRTSPQSR